MIFAPLPQPLICASEELHVSRLPTVIELRSLAPFLDKFLKRLLLLHIV